jgi:hypothetical protein
MTIDIAILLGVAVTALVGGYFAGTLQSDSAAYIDGYTEGKKEVCRLAAEHMTEYWDERFRNYVNYELRELE